MQHMQFIAYVTVATVHEKYSCYCSWKLHFTAL